MTSTPKAVCVIAALLAALGASAAMASPLLTAEEMSAMKGGWTQQYYCISHWCGTYMPCSGFCEWPDDPPCNPREEIPEFVDECYGRTGQPEDRCRKGTLTECGAWVACKCYKSVHEDYCIIDINLGYGSQSWYWPCLEP